MHFLLQENKYWKTFLNMFLVYSNFVSKIGFRKSRTFRENRKKVENFMFKETFSKNYPVAVKARQALGLVVIA